MEQNLYKLISNDNYNLKYSQLFSMLLQLPEEQAIMKLQKLSINRNEWNKLLKIYKYHNPEQEIEYSYLSNLYEKYIKEFQIEKEEETDAKLEFYTKQLEDYVKCNISAFEYCNQEKISLSDLNVSASYVYRRCPELYEKYTELRDKISSNFENKIKKIVDKMINQEDFDLFDYYYETLLSFDDFLRVSRDIIDNESLLKLRIKIKILKRKLGTLANINENQIMESKIIISGREISQLEKRKILKFLKNHNMTLKLYPIAVRKYLKNDNYFFEGEYKFNISKVLDNILSKEDFELHEYVRDYISYNNQSHDDFWTEIKYAANALSPDNSSIIDEKKKRYLICDKFYVQAIHRFLSGKTKDFSELFLYYERNAIVGYLNNYINYFSYDKEKIEKIINNIDYYLQLPCANFKDVIKRLSEKEKKSNFLEFASVILNNSEEESFAFLRKRNFSEDKIDNMIKSLKNRFPNQPEIENIKLTYAKYKEYYSCKLKKEVPSDIDYCSKLIMEIFNSNKTVEEYCSMTGESFDNCHSAITSRKSSMKKEIDIILSRDNSEFEKMIKIMAYQFIKDPNFDLTMYYDFTKLKFIDFFNSCKKIISNEKVYEKVRILIRKNEKTLKMEIVKKVELEGKTIISGREITREEKEKVFDYMEEKKYPISLYSIVLRKYLLSSISFDKQKTYE